MTFTLLFIGIIACILIARYNESNALFWKLFLSLVLGIAVGSIYYKITTDNKGDENLTQQVCPMQASTASAAPFECLYFNDTAEYAEDFSQAPAGKDYTPADCVSVVTSKVSSSARDQPEYIDDS